MSLSERFSILIADDDDAWRLTVRDVLEPHGYDLLLASTGREALNMLAAQPVHCLLLDMQMPELTGLETLLEVRRTWRTLPCIFMTASVERSWLRQVQMLRVVDVLTKPVSREIITRTVRFALESPKEMGAAAN